MSADHTLFWLEFLEVLQGRQDGRKEAAAIRKQDPMSSPALRICRLFLWHRYQYEAEGLPNKFVFDVNDKGQIQQRSPGTDYQLQNTFWLAMPNDNANTVTLVHFRWSSIHFVWALCMYIYIYVYNMSYCVCLWSLSVKFSNNGTNGT